MSSLAFAKFEQLRCAKIAFKLIEFTAKPEQDYTPTVLGIDRMIVGSPSLTNHCVLCLILRHGERRATDPSNDTILVIFATRGSNQPE